MLPPVANRWRLYLAQFRYAECPAEGVDDFAGGHVLVLYWSDARILGIPFIAVNRNTLDSQ